MSPTRGGANVFSTGFPSTDPMAVATSFTVTGALAATLKIRPLAPPASAARIVPSTTFDT